MAARTSSQDGLWSASSTWGGSAAPGIGDTASIGHNITVDVDTTVGTSPNDVTTFVIDVTAAKTITVAAGKTLTIRGNMRHINACGLTLSAGASCIYDNSASGGTPIYVLSNAGGTNYTFNGASGSRCTFGAIAGQTCSITGAVPGAGGFTATFTDFVRISAWAWASTLGSVSITDCTFTTCGRFDVTSATTTFSFVMRRTSFASGSHATDDIRLNYSAAAVSGTREMTNCVLTKGFTNAAKSFVYKSNYLGAGHAASSVATWSQFTNNFIKQDGTLNGGNGQLTPNTIRRNYWVVEAAGGNPHFIAPTALGADTTVEQNIFESQSPDLVDVGDCVLLNGTNCSGGAKIVAQNNISLPAAYVGSTVSSGCMATLFTADAATVSQWIRNTANVSDSVSAVGKRGAFAFAEGNAGTAGQVAVLKSNLAWSTATGGYLGERVSGNVKDIITAAAADKNWVYNTSAGDNGRGYEDRAASNTLWTAGNATAASVDVNQGTGDPAFVGSARNVASWNGARGYGAATYAAGLTSLQADTTRIADLINFVFEGFKPTNTAMRSAAHDGGCAGAANFHKARRRAAITAHRSGLAQFGTL